MTRSMRIILLLLIGIVTSGCSLLTGRPQPPVDVDSVATKLTEKLKNIDDINIDTVRERNAGINDALIVIDFRYSEFINNAGLQQRIKSATTDFVLLSLNLAGTAVGGAGTKTLLAALSAGVSGTNVAFDKTFIYESTVPALIMQMNADRAEKYRQIVSGMKQGIGNYSWTQSVRDLIDYYNAGTLQNAINTIKKNAGNKQVKEEERTEGIVMSPKAMPEDVITKRALTASLNNIDKMDDEKFTEVKTILEPLAKALNHLGGCKGLSLLAEQTTSKDDVKNALQNCIRDVGEGKGRAVAEDLAILDAKFREVDLIVNKTN